MTEVKNPTNNHFDRDRMARSSAATGMYWTKPTHWEEFAQKQIKLGYYKLYAVAALLIPVVFGLAQLGRKFIPDDPRYKETIVEYKKQQKSNEAGVKNEKARKKVEKKTAAVNAVERTASKKDAVRYAVLNQTVRMLPMQGHIEKPYKATFFAEMTLSEGTKVEVLEYSDRNITMKIRVPASKPGGVVYTGVVPSGYLKILKDRSLRDDFMESKKIVSLPGGDVLSLSAPDSRGCRTARVRIRHSSFEHGVLG